MKFLILMSYYNRPIIVENALNSILRANEHHQDWHLAMMAAWFLAGRLSKVS